MTFISLSIFLPFSFSIVLLLGEPSTFHQLSFAVIFNALSSLGFFFLQLRPFIFASRLAVFLITLLLIIFFFFLIRLAVSLITFGVIFLDFIFIFFTFLPFLFFRFLLIFSFAIFKVFISSFISIFPFIPPVPFLASTFLLWRHHQQHSWFHRTPSAHYHGPWLVPPFFLTLSSRVA